MRLWRILVGHCYATVDEANGRLKPEKTEWKEVEGEALTVAKCLCSILYPLSRLREQKPLTLPGSPSFFIGISNRVHASPHVKPNNF